MTLRKFKLILSYICHDCDVIFSVHTKIKGKRKMCCPSCGESLETERLNKKIPERPRNKNWTEEELKLLDRCIAGELKPYYVAFKTKRTARSVRTRLTRRRKELETTSFRH